jgi:hypothetical protein
MSKAFRTVRPLSVESARKIASQIEVPVDTFKIAARHRDELYFSRPQSVAAGPASGSGDPGSAVSDYTGHVTFDVETIKGKDYLVESSKSAADGQQFPYKVYRPIYTGADGRQKLCRLTSEDGALRGIGREKTMFLTRFGRTIGISEVPVPFFCSMREAAQAAKECAKLCGVNSSSYVRGHSIVFRIHGDINLDEVISRISAAESKLAEFFNKAEEAALKRLARQTPDGAL